jgi:hypothetical protein
MLEGKLYTKIRIRARYQQIVLLRDSYQIDPKAELDSAAGGDGQGQCRCSVIKEI